VYFKNKIGSAPKVVQEYIGAAVKSSTRTTTTINLNSRVAKGNQLCLMIINEIFNGDLNFLAHRDELTHITGNVDNVQPEPKHELDLEFDDVNAYGDLIKIK
jgi:hypothetical protein